MNQIKRLASRKGESGQAIVLIALFMIVMLAMVGVAIDGGGLFWLWRNAQNAADTAALQAAYDKCTGGDDWIGTGEDAAASNGFDVDNPGYENMVVQVGEVPVNGTNYVRVRIQATKPKYFIQLVYRGPLEVIAESLVYCSEAVDFSDLPGMTALGSCGECSSGAADRIDFMGADFLFDGDMHSNCNIDVNPGGGGHDGNIEGDVSASGGTIDDHGRTEISGENDPNADEIPMPPLIPASLYFPGGEIFEGINRDNPGMAIYVDEDDNDYTTAPPNSARYTIGGSNAQGLYAVDGNVIIDPSSFGPEGLTVVASGTIDYGDTARGDGQNLQFYGHNSANAPYDEGVTRRWSRGDGSAMLLYSLLDTRPVCTQGESSITWGGGGGRGELGDVDLDGMIYTPYGGVLWRGSAVTVRGTILAQRIDGSGSDQTWIVEPSYMQPMAPVMNNAQ